MAEFRRLRLAVFLDRGDVAQVAASDDSALTAVMVRAAAVFADSLTRETRRSYISRFEAFERWCLDNGRTSLPADCDTLILYLQHLVDDNPTISLATLRGRVAAVSRITVEAGYPAISRDTAIGLYFRGLRPQLGTHRRSTRVKPLRISELRQIGEALPTQDARMIRDRAIFTLVAAGLTPAEVSRLEYSDIVVRARSAWLRLHGGPAARRLRLVDEPGLPLRSAVIAWRDVIAPEPNRIFTTTDQYGTRSSTHITASDIERTMRRRLQGLGLPDGPESIPRAISLLARGNPETLRDRALILLGWAAALRRVDLQILRWQHLTNVDEGILLYLPFSKTDRSGKGRQIGIPYGRNRWSCPVTAVHAWRDHVSAQLSDAQLADAPVFVPLGRSGAIASRPMSTAAISAVLERRARLAGLEGRYGGRSLRSGLITSASEAGASMEEIQAVSGHQSLESLIRYIDRSDPFRRNAARSAGL